MAPCLVDGADGALSDAISYWFLLNPDLKAIIADLVPADLKALIEGLGKGAGSGRTQTYYVRPPNPDQTVELCREKPSSRDLAA